MPLRRTRVRDRLRTRQERLVSSPWTDYRITSVDLPYLLDFAALRIMDNWDVVLLMPELEFLQLAHDAPTQGKTLFDFAGRIAVLPHEFTPCHFKSSSLKTFLQFQKSFRACGFVNVAVVRA